MVKRRLPEQEPKRPRHTPQPKQKPRFLLVRFDQTKYWTCPLVQAACKRLLGVYFFNEREVTYCCELTPSYCCWPRETIPADDAPLWQFKNETLKDHILDLIRQGDAESDGIIYVHCHTLQTEGLKLLYEPDDEHWQELLTEYPDHEERTQVLVDYCVELLNTGAVQP